MVEEDLWCSYNLYDGPGVSAHADGFTLSVVLDAGTKDHFSGIRLVIVYEETEFLDNLQIRDCLQIERHGIKGSQDPVSNRDLLRLHRYVLEEKAHQYPPSNRPLFIISLQAILRRTDGLAWAELEPRKSCLSSEHLRVAYDGTFISNSGSVFNVFESNVTFQHAETYTVSPHALFRLRKFPIGIPSYSARILPVGRNSPPCYHMLPSSILQYIAQATVDRRSKNWRSDLLSVGVVCKAWTCMLDVFFTVLTSVDGEDIHPPTPMSVARSLQLRPERGQLMDCFRLEDYKGLKAGIDNEKHFMDRCRSVLTILTYATEIRSLHLPGIHASLRNEFTKILSRLTKVEKCTIYDRDSHMGQIIEFNIGEIQQFISGWEGLRELNIAFRTIVSTRAFDNEVPELKGKLERLRLRTSHLTGRQFVRFSSCHLRHVELERLNGPVNRDLLAFLIAAAPSLTRLAIRSCPFLRQVQGEEYALDAVMDQLCALEQLTVSGDILSAQAIAKKGPGKDPTSVLKFTATLVPALYLEELADALDTTGWKSITIKTLPGYMDEADLAMKQEAEDIATWRNIEFTYNPVC
ncbi:hypothetical protein H0H92_006101 [Tricholoma furcatifolium]|nr:hypothetical protein H0H92_006101 [Tricholoma furcatifolium]